MHNFGPLNLKLKLENKHSYLKKKVICIPTNQDLNIVNDF
jgi:hypothetical protein